MTRSELALLLLTLVQRNAITPAEMVEVLRRFDAGELADSDLPLPASQDESRDSDQAWELALLVVFVLAGGRPGQLNDPQRKRARHKIRLEFEQTVTKQGIVIAAGQTPVATWHEATKTAITDYARRMAILGAGALPATKTQTAIESNLSDQWPYLQHFATQIMVGLVVDSPMSNAAIIARSALYGGTGWASYFIGTEEQVSFGWVARYISRDDRYTCSPCAESARNGPYLLGEGPFPGSVCLGAGNCRCERVTVYDPEAYAMLTR